MARWQSFAEGSPPSTDTIMHLVCGVVASICGCCRNATYGCMSCVTRARRINSSQPQGNAQMLYSRRDLDARKQNRIESGHRRSQTLPCQDPPRKDRSPYMWEGVWCEESRCPDVQYSCIYVSVTPLSSVHGNTARRSSGAFRLLRRKVRHFAAECVLPWFAGEFAKRARLHTRTRLRILPAGFARFLGKRKFLSPDDDRCFNARMEGCEGVLARLSMLLR